MTSNYKKALELAKQGQWDEAHQLVQTSSDQLSCLVHAYLHRLEDNEGNAHYWYSRANETFPCNTLDEEWQRLYDMEPSD